MNSHTKYYGSSTTSNPYDWSYASLSDQPSDRLGKYVDNIIEGRPIVLTNKLPVDLLVIQDIRFTDISKYVGELKSRGTLELSGDSVQDGDIFNFVYRDPISNTPKFACKSHAITKRQGGILVGNVSSFISVFKRDFSAGGDMTSINIHNLLPWPLTIELDKKPVMYIERNIDLGNPQHHGDLTVSPSVYFDNFNRGINLGTTFDVYAGIQYPQSSTSGQKTYLYSFSLSDIDVDHIFIGDVAPIIDRKNFTSATPALYQKNTTGRSIYRIGSEAPFSKAGDILEKNSPKADLARNSFSHPNVRSTVPSARYKKLSGENVTVLCG